MRKIEVQTDSVPEFELRYTAADIQQRREEREVRETEEVQQQQPRVEELRERRQEQRKQTGQAPNEITKHHSWILDKFGFLMSHKELSK